MANRYNRNKAEETAVFQEVEAQLQRQNAELTSVESERELRYGVSSIGEVVQQKLAEQKKRRAAAAVQASAPPVRVSVEAATETQIIVPPVETVADVSPEEAVNEAAEQSVMVSAEAERENTQPDRAAQKSIDTPVADLVALVLDKNAKYKNSKQLIHLDNHYREFIGLLSSLCDMDLAQVLNNMLQVVFSNTDLIKELKKVAAKRYREKLNAIDQKFKLNE